MAEDHSIRVRHTTSDHRLTAVAFHPTEPFVLAGLESGDVCLCACRTDALTAQVEYERANRRRTGSGAETHTHLPYLSAQAPAAGWRLLRVLELPVVGRRADAQTTTKPLVQHISFLSGREDDLLQAFDLLSAADGEKDARRDRARHLAVLVTAANDVLVVDVMANTLLRLWEASTGTIWARDKGIGELRKKDIVKAVHRGSPFHPENLVTQIGTFGALLFCVVAKRDAVAVKNKGLQATMARLAKTAASEAGVGAVMDLASRSPELLYGDCQNHYLFVCHLGHTHPFAKPHKSQLGIGKGAYIITPQGSANKVPLAFIRVHPLAPIVMAVTATSVRVYGIDGSQKAVPYAVLQKPAGFDMESGAGPSVPRPDSAVAPPWLLDADFLPTAVVTKSSSSPSSLVLENLSVVLLTSRRVSVVDCSFSSEDKRIRTATGAATASSEAGTPRASQAACYAPRERAYAVPRNGGLCYHRLYTWLGSPSTLLVQQSNRQLVEYIEGDVPPLAVRLLTTRSVRTLPQRCGYGWYRDPVTATGASLSAVSCCFIPHALRLPMWGLQDRLPFASISEDSGESGGVNPLLDAVGEHRLVLSTPTHVAAWGRTCFSGPSAATAAGAQISSIVADTSSIDACSICFHVAFAPGSPSTQPHGGGGVLTVARVLGTAPVSLLAFEHSLYFVGTRAQASNVFVVGGVVYATKDASVILPTAATDESLDAVRTPAVKRSTNLHAALFCCPASSGIVQQAARVVAEAAAAAEKEGPGATAARLQSTPLARAAGVHPVPVPSFPAVDGAGSTGDEKALLSLSFQLTNDGPVIPCVWSLWAPPLGSKQLVLQRFSIAEDRATPMWSAPQLVAIQNKAYENPTQVFSLATVGGMRCAWPQEASIVGQLFLFYEESSVLVLATVERGSQYVVSSNPYGRMLFASESSTADYGVASGESSLPGPSGPTRGSGAGGYRNADGELHLVPQAAVELTEWGSGGGGGGGYGSGPLQLTATLSSDGNAVLVAVASRRLGFAIAEFPVIGRLREGSEGGSGAGSGVATLVKERVLCVHRWSALEPPRPVNGPSAQEQEDREAAEEAVADRDRASPAMANLSPGQRAVRQSQRRAARDERCAPRDAAWDESTSPVALFQWIFLASGIQAIASTVPGRGGPAYSGAAVDESHVTSFVLVQRFRHLFAVHPSGHITRLCAGINNCVPLGVTYTVADAGGDTASTANGPQAPPPVSHSGQSAIPLLPLGKLNATSASGADSIKVLRVAVQYGDFAGLLPHLDRCRQRFMQSRFALRDAPRLTVEGADGTVAFVPGKSTKQSKPRRSPSDRLAAGGACKDAPVDCRARDVQRLTEIGDRHKEAEAMRESLYSRVSGWVTESDAALRGASSLTPSWTVVRPMDVTDALRAAVVRMHAMDVSRAITQLVTSSVMLTSTIRGTCAALRQELDESALLISTCASAADTPSLLGGDLPTARVLATVPLPSATACLAHEFCRAKMYDDGLRQGRGGAGSGAHALGNDSADALRQSQASLQRWWLLVMQSYVLVNALNDSERDGSAAAVDRVLAVDANPFCRATTGGPSTGPVITAEVVGEVLLRCPVVFQPSSLWASVATTVAAAKGQAAAGFLQEAVDHALRLLGGRTSLPAVVSSKEKEAADNGAAWLQKVLASLALDGAHWLTSVLLDRLYYNLKGIAEGSAASTGTADVDRQLAAAADAMVAVMDSSSELETAAAAVEVAASTVRTLMGTGDGVAGASREKLAAAVAVSVSRRKKVMGVATPRALAGEGATPRGTDVGMSALLRRLDTVPGGLPASQRSGDGVGSREEEGTIASTAPQGGGGVDGDTPQDVLLRPPGELGSLDELSASPDTALLAQLDRIRADVYAAHWRALYRLSAYPALCWQTLSDRGAGAGARRSGQIPLQVTHDPAREIIRTRPVDAPPTRQEVENKLTSAEAVTPTYRSDAAAPAAAVDSTTRLVATSVAPSVGPDGVTNDLAELRQRMAAPASVSTRVRRDGADVPVTPSPAPLRAEDFFERMAESASNDSVVW